MDLQKRVDVTIQAPTLTGTGGSTFDGEPLVVESWGCPLCGECMDLKTLMTVHRQSCIDAHPDHPAVLAFRQEES